MVGLIRRIGCQILGHSDEWDVWAQELRCTVCGQAADPRMSAMYSEWRLAGMTPLERATDDVARAFVAISDAIRINLAPALQKAYADLVAAGWDFE